MRRFLSKMLLVFSLPFAFACSEALSPETLAGTYVATTFTLSGVVTGDVLSAGGSFTITLNADGTAEGSLFVPAAVAGGEVMDANLVGTYTLAGETITFTHDADTFVRDVTWTIDGSELRATGTFSDVTITVVLSRQ